MHIKTLLNYVTKFKGFVYQNPRLDKTRNALFVPVITRKNSKPLCSRCGTAGSVYDHLAEREFYCRLSGV